MLPFVLSVVLSIFAASTVAAIAKDCHGRPCHPEEEYCSAFIDGCDLCSHICDNDSHNFNADMCAKECAVYKKYEPLKAEIHNIQTKQNMVLCLLTVLLVLIAIRYAFKCLLWLRHKRCLSLTLRKLYPKKEQPHNNNGKDLGGTTIQNVMTVNEMERAPSQIYSATGAEGSVMTMTTPVSTRYPAENSTTPTTITTEYSYDNQALAVTPVSEKPNGGTQAF